VLQVMQAVAAGTITEDEGRAHLRALGKVPRA
jgi:hypothetical protein